MKKKKKLGGPVVCVKNERKKQKIRGQVVFVNNEKKKEKKKSLGVGCLCDQ